MPGWLVLSEFVLFFGGILAVIAWQYHDLNKRARARRLAAEGQIGSDAKP